MSLLNIALRGSIAVVFLVSLFASMIPDASAQAGVNGRNATAVDFGQGAVKQGEYRQTAPRQWVETNQKGDVTFRFEETQRDDSSVYLVDRARGVNIQLDLHTRKVMYSDAKSPRRPLYDIYGARAQPAPQAPTQAAPSAPSPAAPSAPSAPPPVATPSVSPPVSTVAPITIYGRTATSVDYGEGGRKTGEFRQTTTREWVEMNAAGAVTFRFEETQRDLWSVYLVDRSRNINIQLDLQARKVMLSQGNAPPSALYDIIGARSQAATVKAVPVSPSPAQPSAPIIARPSPGAITPPPSAGDIAQRVVFGAAEPDICWKESYTRGAGSIPNGCPKGQERDGLLCYPTCRAGYTGIGPGCYSDCPAEFRNDGLFCAKPAAYGRGFGFAYNPFALEGRDAARERCEREHGAGNCERNLEMYYPKCKAGFQEFGSNVCTPVCPAGMTNIGVSCAKASYDRGLGEGLVCTAGMEQDFQGGLCYPQCRAGTTGIAFVCWHGCPAAYPVNCGAACGVSSSACAFAIMEQVQSSADLTLNIAALIATAGAASAPLRAAQTAGRSARKQLTKTARDQLKQQAKNQLEAGLKYQRRGKSVERAQGWLDNASNVNTASELLVAKYETGEFDFTTLTPSVADVEPTGILAVVNSFNKPICK